MGLLLRCAYNFTNPLGTSNRDFVTLESMASIRYSSFRLRNGSVVQPIADNSAWKLGSIAGVLGASQAQGPEPH